MDDTYVFNPDDLNDEERKEFDLMVYEEMLKLENSLKEEKEEQQQLRQQQQQLIQNHHQKQQQIQQPPQQQQPQQYQQQKQQSYSNVRYESNDISSKDSEYNSLAFGNSSIRRPTPPTQKYEEMMNRKTKQNEYAKQLEEDRLVQQKHLNTSNRNVTDVPMALNFGRDINTEYQIKKDKQAQYLQQLNAQQMSNQKIKESELAFAFSSSEKPKPQSPIYNQNEIPFRFARTRGPHNELVDEEETKRFKQKVYMDEIKSSRIQQPIATERVSLRSLGRNKKGIDDDDEPAFGATSLINSIGGNIDNDRTKRMKQQAYAKQLQDSSSLQPIYTERISLNSHSEVKKRRELMEIASNDNGSVNLANLARHVASDFYGNVNESQSHKTYSNDNDSASSFFATGLSTIGPHTANNNKRQQQQQYARQLEEDRLAQQKHIGENERVSLKEHQVRRDPSNTTLRLNSHDISTTDRLESERYKREEYVSLSEQDKYRNPIPSSRAPIIRASSPAGGMTGLSIGDDEAKRMLEKEKKLNYSRQLANDAKQKPIEVERVPLSPRLRKQMALKLYRKEQEEAQHLDSMDIATAQHLEQRERLRRPMQPDQVIDTTENGRMKSLLTQYEVPSKSSTHNDTQTNSGYPQQRGNGNSSGGGELQWSINPVDAAERQAAMRINRLGKNEEYADSLRDQIIQLSSRKDPYDYAPKESPRDHYSSLLLGLPTNWARAAPIENEGRNNTYQQYPNSNRDTYSMGQMSPADLDARAIEILKQRQAYINNNNPNESIYFGTQQKALQVPKDYTY